MPRTVNVVPSSGTGTVSVGTVVAPRSSSLAVMVCTCREKQDRPYDGPEGPALRGRRREERERARAFEGDRELVGVADLRGELGEVAIDDDVALKAGIPLQRPAQPGRREDRDLHR